VNFLKRLFQKKNSNGTNQFAISFAECFPIDSFPLFLDDEKISTTPSLTLSNEQVLQLSNWLKKNKNLFQLQIRLLEAKKELDESSSKLSEVTTTVTSIQELLDETTKGYNFTLEKIALFKEERNILSKKIEPLIETLQKAHSKKALSKYLLETFESVTLQDHTPWLPKIQALQERFLVQKPDQNLDFKKNQETKRTGNDPLRPKKEEPKIDQPVLHFSMKVELIFQKLSKELLSELKVFNDLQKRMAVFQILESTNSKDRLKKDLAEKKKQITEVNSKFYKLKRQEGISNLKLHDTIQSLRSKLINISGFLADREILLTTIHKLKKLSKSPTKTTEELRSKMIESTNRLYTILTYGQKKE
jgi:hypothetical protein